MDYLKTNWTEKIKTNPVANMILNGKKVDPTYMVNVRHIQYLKPKGDITLRDLYKYSKPAPGLIPYDTWVKDDKYIYGSNWMDGLKALNDQRKKEKARKKAKKMRKNARIQHREQQQQQQQQQQQNNNNNENVNIEINNDQAQVQPQGTQYITIEDDANTQLVAARKGAIAPNEQQALQNASQGDVHVQTEKQVGNAIVIDDEESDISSDYEMEEVYAQDDDGNNIPMLMGFEGGEVGGSSGMWDNVYVKDFININHPKLRSHYISALTSKPVQIAEPSVFFSDV